MLSFKYFRGPAEDMSDLADGPQACSLCGRTDSCFSLEYALCDELKGEEKRGKLGCVRCLRSGRFEFWHDTDIGMLDEHGLSEVYNHNRAPPASFPESAVVELRRTPQIVTWQQEVWLTHCNDFMVYQGTWAPEDFYNNAPGGDGRALFMEMTDEYRNLWDDSLPDGETVLKRWHATYYVFRCGACGKLRGNWDCD